MNNIVFITGMAGAGKSTVGRLVARYFPYYELCPTDLAMPRSKQ